MKTAIYIRVSTGSQAIDGYSLDSQKELCFKKATELNVKSSEISLYREEGVSGEDLDRPELNNLREDVSKGLVKTVICVHPDRLSRDLTDKLLICRELQRFDVELIFVDTEYKNTPEGQLFFNMQSSIAQYELALIKKRTTRGRLEAVRKEKKVMPMRVPPYGYDLTNSQLTINRDEEFFVKKIYEWYVYDKLTLREIGNKLYELGAEPKRKESKNWNASSIRRILTSPIYTGKYYYNRRKSRKVKGERTASGKPRKEYTVRDPTDWIIIDVPALIDEDLFKLAQEQKVKNTKKSGNQKYEYLLKSILRCSYCGRMYQATTYNSKKNKITGEVNKYPVYRCPNLFPKKYGPSVQKCQSRSIRADLLESFIWNTVIKIINSPEELIGTFKENHLGSIDDIEITLKRLGTQLNKKQKERERVKQLFVKGFIEEEEMSAEFLKISSEIKTLDEEQKKYQNYLNDYNAYISDENLIKEVISNVSSMLEKNSFLLSFKEKRYIIENLINEIVLKFEEDLETVNVTILGAINAPSQKSDPELSLQNQEI
ncbi:recombinase family protein [Metabacillus sp. cB07]|uniref:recombinase family protein n=1 Tax=Metabacillus sp. cB07 TaxID=2806989 RepID=UPI00193A0028|nr:recombinase family protein [Metabacillus sp. cB07]